MLIGGRELRVVERNAEGAERRRYLDLLWIFIFYICRILK